MEYPRSTALIAIITGLVVPPVACHEPARQASEPTEPARPTPQPGTGAGDPAPPPTTATTGSGGAPAEAWPGGGAYPVPDWPEGDPEDHGLDPAALEQAAALADQLESYCLLVIRDGVLVGEWYWRGREKTTKNQSWSIAKSYTSALVGIAIDRGEIQSLQQPVTDFITEWQGGPHDAILVEDLLTMTSGLEWGFLQDYIGMAGLGDDHSAHALDRELDEPPGTEWVYNNAGVQIFSLLLERATGMDVNSYADTHLFGPLGMDAAYALDPAGNATTYANVLATCRDHARLGYLYRYDGYWAEGRAVVPASHVQASLVPHQSFNGAYGYLWWLNGGTPTLNPLMEESEAELVPGLPADLFAAIGMGNQFVDVIPSEELIVVRMGRTVLDEGSFELSHIFDGFDDARFDDHADIMQAVVAAVVGPPPPK